jgi:phytoene/squalene synthetase
MSDDLTVVGVDGIRRSFHKHYDVMDEVMRDPQGAFYAIQRQADRIEELCVLHREYEKILTERIEELEAKLAKAIDILQDAERMCVDGHPVSAFNLARMTLAELKGEDRG